MRIALLFTSVTFLLAGCATQTAPIAISNQSDTQIRARIATEVEKFGTFSHMMSTAGGGGMRPRMRFQKAFISGPHGMKTLIGGETTYYCVVAEFEGKEKFGIFGQDAVAHVEVRPGATLTDYKISISGRQGTPPSSCRLTEARPFPELIDLRNRVMEAQRRT